MDGCIRMDVCEWMYLCGNMCEVLIVVFVFSCLRFFMFSSLFLHLYGVVSMFLCLCGFVSCCFFTVASSCFRVFVSWHLRVAVFKAKTVPDVCPKGRQGA